MDKTKIIFGGLFIITLLVGIIVGTSLTQNKQSYRSQASEINLKVINPSQGESVAGVIGILTSSTSPVSEEGLSAVYSVEEISQKMSIQKSQDGTVVLRATLNTDKLSVGNHTLKIYLYQNQDSIGQTAVDIVTSR